MTNHGYNISVNYEISKSGKSQFFIRRLEKNIPSCYDVVRSYFPFLDRKYSAASYEYSRIIEKNTIRCQTSKTIDEFNKKYPKSKINFQEILKAENELTDIIEYISDLSNSPYFEIINNENPQTIEKLQNAEIITHKGFGQLWHLVFSGNSLDYDILQVYRDFNKDSQLVVINSPLNNEASWAKAVNNYKAELLPTLVSRKKAEFLIDCFKVEGNGNHKEGYYKLLVNPFRDNKVYVLFGSTGCATCGNESTQDIREFETKESALEFINHLVNYVCYEPNDYIDDEEINLPESGLVRSDIESKFKSTKSIVFRNKIYFHNKDFAVDFSELNLSLPFKLLV